jgi:hypothetical protein
MGRILIAALLGLGSISIAACGGSSETCSAPPRVATVVAPPAPPVRERVHVHEHEHEHEHEHVHVHGRAGRRSSEARAEDRRRAEIVAQLEARLRQIQRRVERQVREAERAAEHARRTAEEALRNAAARLRGAEDDDDDDNAAPNQDGDGDE